MNTTSAIRWRQSSATMLSPGDSTIIFFTSVAQGGGMDFDSNSSFNSTCFLNGSSVCCLLNGSSELNNCTNNSSNGTSTDIGEYRHPVHIIVMLSIMYGFTFVSALLGNMAIVAMVIKDRRFHSATYILIMNLAIADLIVTIVCHPINLVTMIFTGWQFGAFMCKAVPFLQGVAVCASVNTLVVIAIDRYVAICHVMRPRNTKRITRIILLIIWMVAVALMTPWALYYRIKIYPSTIQDFDVCFEDFPEKAQEKAFFLGVIFLTCYALPLMFIVVCYALIGYRVWHRDAPGITSSKGVIEKSKIRVVKMLVVVVLLFMFSWMPLYTARLIVLFSDLTSDDEQVIGSYVVPFAQWLGTSNSCMNPLVYCLFSQKIRRRIKAMVCCSKQEFRTLYSKRSMYSSVVQNHSGSCREVSIAHDPSLKGYNSCYGLHYGGGNLTHHRTKNIPGNHTELISLNSSSSGKKSSHV